MWKYKILVVEDESIVAMDLKQRLTAMDYEVIATVSNGKDAIEKYDKCPADIILMDIQIKGDIDGIETAKIIQNDYEVPIVFLTANSDLATVNRAKETAPLAYLLKPFESKGLQTTIEIALYRFQLEQKLKSSESWLQAVLKSIGDAVITTDKVGQIVFLNKVAEELTGWSSEEATNLDFQKVMNLVSEKTGEPVECPIRQCLNENRNTGSIKDAMLISLSDKKIPIENNASLIRNDNGTHIGCVITFRDISVARESEKKIVAYQEQLKNLLAIRTDELHETVANLSQETNKRSKAESEIVDLTKFPEENPDPIMRVNKNGVLNYANKASTFILNSWECTTNQIIPAKWKLLVSEALLKEKNLDLVIEIEDKIYSIIIAPFIDAGYVNLYGKDITWKIDSEKKERELQTRLERAERMESLGLLAGGVAHDLNNMLSPIVAYPELILEELPDDSSIRKPIEQMGKSAQDAACVIQDLLTLARRGRYEMTPLSLNQVISDCLRSPGFKSIVFEHPEITIKKNFESDIPLINGSAPHLSKVIMNLTINAFDAMKGKGQFIIETKCETIDKLKSGYNSIKKGKYIILKVKDTGCGIKDKDVGKIFEPYFSKKELLSRSGSGLGLSVVYGVLKDHGGFYDIVSEVGKGTEFILYFPTTDKVLVQHVEDKKSTKGNEKILIIDDNEVIRDLLNNVLSKMGYETFIANNGTEAVKFMQNNSVDLLILDMIMEKDFDGLDTYRKILENHPMQKAIIVSGFSSTKRVETALELGAGAYVKKPFKVNNLAKIVRDELDKEVELTSAS